MQGIFVCLIIAAWSLMLLSLLFSSMRLRVRMKCGLRGGGGRLTVEWLFFRYTLFLRANLLRQPYLTLEIVRRSGKVRRISRFLEKKLAREAPELPVPDMMELHILAGVKDEPALCAAVCGLLHETVALALPALLPKGWPERLRLSVAPSFCADTFFIECGGMITLSLAQIIAIGIQMRKRGV